jgi:DNA-binding LytR/AlgR family response regulator
MWYNLLIISTKGGRDVLHIAVVDDESDVREQLCSFLVQYQRENELPIQASAFSSGEELLAGDYSKFDIIFLDIEMPGLSGMETAEEIRRRDADVVLVFVTNITQYAIQGYSVGALDYVLKPINYYTFSVRLARAISRAKKRESGRVILTLPDGAVQLESRQIYYVEVQNRILRYHTQLGEFEVRGTMQKAEEMLTRYHFVRCNHWYLINLLHVTELRKNLVVVAGHELEVSRRSRTSFMRALTDYVGGVG